MQKIKITHYFFEGFWFAAWLFTIGFLQLSFFKGLLAIILWPFFLGEFFAPGI
tara:strand:+ start:4311 stop:4469 length:159 start_codon:yes stop_codon:yes gene_type:complete